MANSKKYGQYLSNRDIKREPKHGKGWCDGCDRWYVSHTQKCPVCGVRSGIRVNKKPGPKE